MGRPSKFKPEFIEQAVKLCNLGATNREMAEFFGVQESTFHLWKIEHSEFSEALKTAKAEADSRVVESLYRRALGYSHDEVHVSNYQGTITLTPIVKHYAPDTVAAIFWLKNRRPEEWRDVKAVEHSGSVAHRHVHELSEAELERIATGSSAGAAEKAPRTKNASGVH